MILKERDTPKGLLVAVCDSGILGKTFENGRVSLTVSEDFYAGEDVDADTVVDSLSRATVANIVGVEAVSLAVENGFVDEDYVLEIGETHHAQMLRMGSSPSF